MFIYPDDKQEYARFSLGLLAYPGVASRPVPVSAARLHQASLSELLTPLPGAPSHTNTFRLRTANDTWLPFRFESYLGAGFGAHPADPESLRLTYVVLKLTPASFDSRALSTGEGYNHRFEYPDPQRVEGHYHTQSDALPSSSARSSSLAHELRGYESQPHMSPYSQPRPSSRSSLFR